jgi:flagellar basal-body rod modification protein FlgD
MLAQQAQFASLEQMQNLNTNLVGLMAMQNVTQATSLIGKFVTGTDASGLPLSGTVSAVNFNNGNPQLQVGTQVMPLPSVKTIS